MAAAENDSPAPAASSTNPSPGERLKQARVAMELEIADVATRLRLSRSTIEHLESDSYHKLPGRTFARGYLRNYARILGLPLDGVLAEFDRLVPGTASRTPTATPSPPTRAGKPQPRHFGYAIGVALAALLLLTVWWQVPHHQNTAELEPAPTQAAQPVADETSQPVPQTVANEHEPVTPPVSLANSSATDANQTSATDANQTSATPASSPRHVVLPTAPPTDSTLNPPQSTRGDGELRAASTPADSNSALERAPEATKEPADSLRLRLAHDSWIEVYDERGARLYYDLAKDGDSIALLGAAPFRLVVGYARDIDIDYNGAPFDPTRYINRDGLARFTLGDVEPAESAPAR